MDECLVFYHLVGLYVLSYWDMKRVSSCAIFLHNRNKVNYTLKNTCMVYFIYFGEFIMWLCLMVSVSMEPVYKKKFVMLWYWWRIEEDTNCLVNKIPENFSL